MFCLLTSPHSTFLSFRALSLCGLSPFPYQPCFPLVDPGRDKGCEPLPLPLPPPSMLRFYGRSFLCAFVLYPPSRIPIRTSYLSPMDKIPLCSHPLPSELSRHLIRVIKIAFSLPSRYGVSAAPYDLRFFLYARLSSFPKSTHLYLPPLTKFLAPSLVPPVPSLL